MKLVSIMAKVLVGVLWHINSYGLSNVNHVYKYIYICLYSNLPRSLREFYFTDFINERSAYMLCSCCVFDPDSRSISHRVVSRLIDGLDYPIKQEKKSNANKEKGTGLQHTKMISLEKKKLLKSCIPPSPVVSCLVTPIPN